MIDSVLFFVIRRRFFNWFYFEEAYPQVVGDLTDYTSHVGKVSAKCLYEKTDVHHLYCVLFNDLVRIEEYHSKEYKRLTERPIEL